LKQKTVYDTDLLDWKKAVDEICKANADSAGCKDSLTLRDKVEARRVSAKFYTKTADD